LGFHRARSDHGGDGVEQSRSRGDERICGAGVHANAEQLAANAAILKRLAEIDKTLLEHDSALRVIWTKLQPLLAPPPEPPRHRIGFNQDQE
jgi:hypothetical protein